MKKDIKDIERRSKKCCGLGKYWYAKEFIGTLEDSNLILEAAIKALNVKMEMANQGFLRSKNTNLEMIFYKNKMKIKMMLYIFKKYIQLQINVTALKIVKLIYLQEQINLQRKNM